MIIEIIQKFYHKMNIYNNSKLFYIYSSYVILMNKASYFTQYKYSHRRRYIHWNKKLVNHVDTNELVYVEKS